MYLSVFAAVEAWILQWVTEERSVVPCWRLRVYCLYCTVSRAPSVRLPAACNSSHNPQPKIGQYLEITRLCILAPSNYAVTLQTCNYRKHWLLKLFITLQHPLKITKHKARQPQGSWCSRRVCSRSGGSGGVPAACRRGGRGGRRGRGRPARGCSTARGPPPGPPQHQHLSFSWDLQRKG